MDVSGGEFAFQCTELTESGPCGEICDLATVDSAETLFRWRDASFPAMQRDYEAPLVYFGTPEYVQGTKLEGLPNMENVVVFDGHMEEQMVDTLLKTIEKPIEVVKKQSVVSFRTRDSYVEVSYHSSYDI
jgi:hypothetical protein